MRPCASLAHASGCDVHLKIVNTQYLQTLKAGRVDEWEWLRFEPVFAGEVGDDFSLIGTREKAPPGRRPSTAWS